MEGADIFVHPRWAGWAWGTPTSANTFGALRFKSSLFMSDFHRKQRDLDITHVQKWFPFLQLFFFSFHLCLNRQTTEKSPGSSASLRPLRVWINKVSGGQMRQLDIRLSCCCIPAAEVIFNVKEKKQLWVFVCFHSYLKWYSIKLYLDVHF